MRNNIVEGESSVFPDPIARLPRFLGGLGTGRRRRRGTAGAPQPSPQAKPGPIGAAPASGPARRGSGGSARRSATGYIPELDIERVGDATVRFLAALDGLTDADVAKPSLCEGWTVGHVLNHVARNADSHVRRAEAALRGEVIQQYAGGLEGRAAEIDAGAARPAAELVEDVRSSAAAVDAAWAKVPTMAWATRSADAKGLERALFELPSRRWQEMEVHVIDLGIGPTYLDWPEEFVVEWLPRTRERLWRDAATPSSVAALEDPRAELAWLYGRLRGEDIPDPPTWG